MAGKKDHSGFGYIRHRGDRYEASYIGPDGARHAASTSFQDKSAAQIWLSKQQTSIADETWIAPKIRKELAEANKPETFAEFSKKWLEVRELKPRTRAHYQSLLDHQLASWNPVQVGLIRRKKVDEWYAGLDPTRPTLRAHAYGLLRTILSKAVDYEILSKNPCHIKSAGKVKAVHQPEPATIEELSKIVEAMPEQLKTMVLLGAWCALRFGELIELRRKDVDLVKGVIHIRRGAVRVHGVVMIGTPKSDAGSRDVSIPPHLLPIIKEHLSKNISGGKEGLLFPAQNGGCLHPTTVHAHFYRAREIAGRPDLRFHDLRHSGAVLAASTGATLAELMGRLGHSTPAAAMRYQHTAKGRDAQIADALSDLAAGRSK